MGPTDRRTDGETERRTGKTRNAACDRSAAAAREIVLLWPCATACYGFITVIIHVPIISLKRDKAATFKVYLVIPNSESDTSNQVIAAKLRWYTAATSPETDSTLSPETHCTLSP